MTPSRKRDFTALTDLSAAEIGRLLARAASMRDRRFGGRPLDGKALAMIFRKSSTRTRVSFEVAIHQLGGFGVFLSDRDSQLGRGEPIPDTAQVLSGYVDAIMVRTFGHGEVLELAEHATVPVINGLSDLLHPCQLLADLLTLRDEFGSDLSRLRVCWVGDGNNMANSWLNAASILGFELRLACPEGYDPDPEILARASQATRILLTRDPAEGAEGAHVLTTDVWASMGQEGESEVREEAFRPFQVNDELMARAREEAIFLHCLPAHRGEEVTSSIIDGPRSRVYPEAANRLHVQKALLVELLVPWAGGEGREEG